MAEARDVNNVKFCTQVGCIKSYQKNENHPHKGHGYGHVTYLILSPPYDISGMAKARDFKIWYTGSPGDGLALGLQTVP